MLKFIRGKGQQPSAERQKIQRELFAFRKTVQHGFPNKPTALAWDPELRLLCIGTASSAVKVFGRPGVEFYGQHAPVAGATPGSPMAPPAVTRLVCLPNGQGRLVSLCDDNSLHLWEINDSSLVEVKSLSLEGKLKKISAICMEGGDSKHLLLGTEGGNIYLLDLATFTMASDIIYQDVVMQNVPEVYKVNPGAVECLMEQPGNPDNLLIGYTRGLMVLWSRSETKALQTFVANQQLESICWHTDGQHFTSSHNDGSYAQWNISSGDNPSEEPTTTYGPFPCKPVTKIDVRELRGNPLIVFLGGMPRASCSDKYTVSVMNGDKHVAFDFTSKVIDFQLITPLSGSLEPDTLIVLVEEELVAIDLLDASWRMLQLPYLVSLHASAVTCSAHVGPVPEDMWRAIRSEGMEVASNRKIFSDREWPINGGVIEDDNKEISKELFLTGHEDGTVRFWDVSGVALTPLYKFSTAALFTGDDIDVVDDAVKTIDEEEEEWPPFRKIGVFDPYSDDPRLAIKKVALCPMSGTLVAAGTAGHVIVAKLSLDGNEQEDEKNLEFKISTMNIVSDRDGFIWKGHEQLTPKLKVTTSPNGAFKTQGLLQLHPPAAITCIALHSEWGLVAAGTAHGLALYDYIKNRPVINKCTLNPNDLTGAGDAAISRRKSFKKSLRESFRRLRKGRSTRRAGATSPSSTTSPSVPLTRKGAASTPDDASPLEAKPVERQVEARPVDDSLGSMVRCLYFARSYLVSVQNTTPTLWAGTNNGTVFVFTITVPTGNKRTGEDVTCQLGKEIQLKHRAPVIAIAVLDGASRPLPEPMENTRVDNTQPHRVIIASEEQFKVFTLPSLRPFCKYKLTAHEGARVRRMSFADFSCKLPDSEEQHNECCLLCLTNLGDCLVLSIPELKRQLNAAAIRREDINGISSLVFTRFGEALYLHSSSELQRITVSASHITAARCHLRLNRQSETNTADENEESTPAPAANSTLVNGNSGSLGSIKEEARENGEDNVSGGGGAHDVTISSSVGDITIDSVKDHLANSSAGALSGSGAESLPDDNATSVTNSRNVTVKTITTTIVRNTTTEQNIVERTVNNSGSTSRTVVETSCIVLKEGGEIAGTSNNKSAPLACEEDELEPESVVTISEID